jgi:hypothetical protein
MSTVSHLADISIGEESVAAGEKEELTDDFTWIVDPIDVGLTLMELDCRLMTREQ